MIKKLIVLACMLAFVPAGISYGQNFDSVYGAGMHQFFSGRSAEAIQSFSAAITNNPNDPRPYYFRGLAKIQCGDSYSGQADFQAGAQMEAAGKRRSNLVSRSLERIQGANRMFIEQARQNALNPSLQSAQYYYGSSPTNVVYGQPLSYPVPAPGEGPPNVSPQSVVPQIPIANVPTVPGATQEVPPNLLDSADSSVIPPAPESTATSLPANPPVSADSALPGANLSAPSSELEQPITLDVVNPPAEVPTTDSAAELSAESAAPIETQPIVESDAATVNEPLESSSSAPVADDSPLEFPSEPTNDSPFGDEPTEDPGPETTDSTDEAPVGESTESDGDINEDPFGG